MVGERSEVGMSFDEADKDHIGSFASPIIASSILSLLLHPPKESLA